MCAIHTAKSASWSHGFDGSSQYMTPSMASATPALLLSTLAAASAREVSVFCSKQSDSASAPSCRLSQGVLAAGKLLLRLREGRSDALLSEEALFHAAAGSAEVLGLGGRVGRLAPGFEADLILVELDRPHLQPFYGEPSSLAFYARASDVRHSVMLLGPAGTGKTTVWKTLAACHTTECEEDLERQLSMARTFLVVFVIGIVVFGLAINVLAVTSNIGLIASLSPGVSGYLLVAATAGSGDLGWLLLASVLLGSPAAARSTTNSTP